MFTCGAEPEDRAATGGLTAVGASAHGGCMPSGTCAPPPLPPAGPLTAVAVGTLTKQRPGASSVKGEGVPHFPRSE